MGETFNFSASRQKKLCLRAPLPGRIGMGMTFYKAANGGGFDTRVLTQLFRETHECLFGEPLPRGSR